MSSTPSIAIRLAATDDAAAIASLLAESFAEYQTLYTPEGYAATSITPKEVIRRLEEGPVWLAISDEQVIGTVSVLLKGEALYIRGMAVSPMARGRRIGETLLIQVEKFGESQGVRRLFLSTTPFLDRAIRLYERFGFFRSEDGPADLFGTPLFTMKKILD